MIELVAVIILLGILAATALPRFVSISAEAYQAKFEATLGGLSSAVSMAHAKWRASGVSGAVQNLSGTLDFNNAGYPAGVDDGVQVGSSTDCLQVFTTLLSGLDAAVNLDRARDIKNLSKDVAWAVTRNSNICYYTYVAESKAIGFNARQIRYTYLTGDVFNFEPGFTLF